MNCSSTSSRSKHRSKGISGKADLISSRNSVNRCRREFRRDNFFLHLNGIMCYAHMSKPKSVSARATWLKPAVIGGIIGFLLGNVPPYYDLYRKWFAEPLQLSTPHISASGTPFISRAYKLPGKDWEIYPAYVMVYAQIHNNGERPVKLESYTASVETDESWVDLTPLREPPDPVAGQNMAIVAFKRKATMGRLDEEKDSLERIAASQSIQNGSNESGWLFFENHVYGNLRRFRLRVVDAEGREHILQSSAPDRSSTNKLLVDLNLHLGPDEPIPDSLKAFVQALPN